MESPMREKRTKRSYEDGRNGGNMVALLPLYKFRTNIIQFWACGSMVLGIESAGFISIAKGGAIRFVIATSNAHLDLASFGH